ncbi:MAG: Glu-tRNA(Gln) amidotransferase subunit GatE [Desulfurococcaceae archaeon]|nr:Glu-tRNA(Gln) amidotransferase subunit GatE [Desulfurococcaceae archaeon]
MSSGGIDYRVLGLKVGLEIHVQLNTRRKLFCPCPTRLSTNYSSELDRYLRPARSEVGEVDPAAMLEWSKKKKYRYLVPREESCLVEADEEPPHFMDRESLLVALAIAKALNMKIVDEIHVMRKIVIDGSNVSGFQRTALIALNGHIRVDDRVIGVQTLCLEEDAARKVEESEVESVYVLDRLGIPLVEIATAPDIDTPELALKTALKIGQLVRLTGKAKWGLGTIRQDINVSIAGGAKTEIKGIQHLYMIPLVVEYEVKRQIELLRIRDELKARGLAPENIKPEVVDVTEVFENTSSKVVKRALEKGGVVLALVLPGFKGILSWSIQPGRRFGTELSDYAKAWGGVGGIFHTDELPGYGISESEVSKLYSATGANSSRDAIVIVADEEEKAKKALIAVAERAKYAIIGIPEETRAANPDGTTRYMRPRPGAARMYPETDIPPILITDDLLEEASRYMPEHPDIKYKHLVEEHGLSSELARALLNDLMLDFYEYLAEKYRERVPCSVIASILVNTIPMLRREGVPVENLSEDAIEDVVKLVAEGVVAKEAVPDLLAYMAKNPGVRAIDAVNALRVKKISVEDLDNLIVNTIERLKTRLLEKRDKAFNIVMGEVMKTVRGSVDGKLVAERVKLKLKEVLGIE